MMRSLFSGVAGLRGHQTAMDIIGANISNVNTSGYKSGRSNFSDIISQTLQGASAATSTRGGTNPIQVGLGVGVTSVDTIFTSGSYQPTGKQTDLAIQNSGFFVVSDGMNNYYTRAGGFDFDSAGNFEVPGSGMKVMGWIADASGVIDPNSSITSIQVPVGKTMAASATSTMDFANNLSGSDGPGSAAQTSLNVYDSQGRAQNLTQQFIKTDATNTWLVTSGLGSIEVGSPIREIKFDPSGKVTSVNQVGATLAATSIVGTDSMKLDNTVASEHDSYYTVFDSNLTPHVLKMTLTALPATNPATTWSYNLTEAGVTNPQSLISGTVTYAAGAYTFDAASLAADSFTVAGQKMTFTNPTTSSASGAGAFAVAATKNYTALAAATPITFTVPGAEASSIALNFGAMTQYGGSSTVQATAQNGYASGSLEATSIDTSGTIVGKFSNGRTQKLAQVALATFTNPGGLTRMGDTLFALSNNSGSPAVGTSGTGGRGSITPGSLEMSNVDLADQFSKMIITQRGFQANSKIITVTDQMLEELANLKR